VRTNSVSWRLTRWRFAINALLLLLGQFLAIRFVLVFFVAILLFILGIYILPTILNMGCSYFLAHRWVERPFPRFALFLALSLLLTINIRMPGVISDLVHVLANPTGGTMSRVIQLHEGDSIYVQTNADSVKFKPQYFEPVRLTGNEGFGFYYQPPRVESDHFVQWLQSKGLKIVNEGPGTAAVTVAIDVRKGEEVSTIQMSIYEGQTKVADYRNRFRHNFPLEDTDLVSVNTLLAFSQNTFWVELLPNSSTNGHPVSEFLNQVLKIDKSPALKS